MNFKIPFTFTRTEILKKRIKPLAAKLRLKKKALASLEKNLRASDSILTKEEYLAISYKTSLLYFIFVSIIISTILFFLNVSSFYFIGLGAGLIFSFYVFFSELNYPRVYANKKTREIERNLIPAMQDMLVQLNSGVPVYQILTNISVSDYGALSLELKKTVKAINSGIPQTEALDELGNASSSLYFRRVLWQFSNGMRAGSDMALVIKDGIDNLSKEQSIQIQSYASKLNPLIMFYMLLAVIIPSLGVTFLTILSSMLKLPGFILQLLYIAIFCFVVLMQIIFLGVVKSKRPSLL